jgi:hypothetical protein
MAAIQSQKCAATSRVCDNSLPRAGLPHLTFFAPIAGDFWEFSLSRLAHDVPGSPHRGNSIAGQNFWGNNGSKLIGSIRHSALQQHGRGNTERGDEIEFCRQMQQEYIARGQSRDRLNDGSDRPEWFYFFFSKHGAYSAQIPSASL